jgi:hypothetical protein
VGTPPVTAGRRNRFIGRYFQPVRVGLWIWRGSAASAGGDEFTERGKL